MPGLLGLIRPSTPAMGCVRRVTGEAVMSEADFETWWQTSRDPAAPFVDVLRQHLAKRLQADLCVLSFFFSLNFGVFGASEWI